MKKRLLALALIIILSSLVAIPAFASPTSADVNYEITVDEDADNKSTQLITIFGNDIEGIADKPIILRIWCDGKSESDYVDVVNPDDSVLLGNLELFATLLQTRSNSEGDFKFEFFFGEDAADYRTDIKIDGEDLITITIPTVDLTVIDAFLAKINDAAQLSSMTSADFDPILANCDSYGISTTVYSNLSNENKLAVLNDVIDAFSANKRAGKRNTMETFEKEFSEETLVAIFKQTDDRDKLLEAFDVYADFMGIDNLSNASGIDELYEALGNEQGDVLSGMGNEGYDDLDELLDEFKSRVFAKSIRNAGYHTDIKDIIDNNIDYLETVIPNSKLDDYLSKNAVATYVCKAIIKQKGRIADIDDFESIFGKAIEEYDDNKDKNSSGGGSGGSSASFDSDIVPAVEGKPTVTGYTDMANHWASDAVTHLSNIRIISGRGDGTFDPNGNITRAEFVKIVALTYNLYDSEATCEFSDVSADKWYYSYVASLVDGGVITGDADGRFRPDDLISRQDMAVILHRVLQKKGLLPLISNLERMFDDFDDVSPYAQNSITYMSNMKLINGYEGKVRPHDPSTRAEAAQIIYNAIAGGEQ